MNFHKDAIIALIVDREKFDELSVKAKVHDEQRAQIKRLNQLVRANEEFFDLAWGDDLLEKAIDKLEEVIRTGKEQHE